MKHYDLIVIGAGSGGLAASQRAAAYGKKVALIEQGKIGGTCVNRGCIAKKIMWNAGQIFENASLGSSYGFKINSKFNFTQLAQQREKFIKSLNQIYTDKIKKSKITYLQGHTEFVDAHTLTLNNQKYTADHIIIATGARSNLPDMTGAEYGIDSDGFFRLKQQPKNVVIIGAGYIAMELASILNQLGSQVKVLVRKELPIRNFDSMISKTVFDILTARGVKFMHHCEADKIISHGKNNLSVHCKNKKVLRKIDCVIFAIGRSPNTKNLNLTAAKVKINEKGSIITDKGETTNIKHIYAIGDVAGKKLLTPVAVAAGRHLADRVFGKNKKSYLDYKNIPTALFTHPPAASVGLAEHDAIEKYGANHLTIETTRFTPLLYALAKRHASPFAMKLISRKSNGKIIGCHLIGINSEEIIQGFAVAMKMGATKADLAKTIGIHPTCAEELITL